jgi:hypothetical protein
VTVAKVGAEIVVRGIDTLAVIAFGFEARFGLGAVSCCAAYADDTLIVATDFLALVATVYAGAGVAITELAGSCVAELIVAEFEANPVRRIASGVAAGTQVGRHAVTVG